MIEQRGMLSSFPALLQAGDDAHRPSGTTCAPRAASGSPATRPTCSLVKPRDGHRYGYRLWADRASGLLLRAEVLGERGEVLETVGLLRRRRSACDAQPESVLQAMRKLDGYRVVRPVLTPTRLEAEGWTMRPGRAGLSLGQLRQPADGAARRAAASAGAAPVIQSDLFRRPDLRLGLHRAVTAPSATPSRCSSAVGRHRRPSAQRHGDWWVTVVGDTPPATLKVFAAALERRKP